MSAKTQKHQETYLMHPIGTIRRNGDEIHLEIDEEARPGLVQLDHFSHVMVFWWAEFFDNEESRAMLQMEPPYAGGQLTGVFASRSPFRPNPIMMTTCKLLEVDEKRGSLKVGDIDAFDGTRIVDLKAYFPVCDRVKESHIPDWLSDWPEWMPENGMGLEEGEAEIALS